VVVGLAEATAIEGMTTTAEAAITTKTLFTCRSFLLVE
jgi:hypothetical protein